ncbi:Estradiol 17-beta-dehydrogenase 12 [Strongyloides ratti]|uniref:Estradiol 17-beta-dehydrogenase 12 n=1 Tax=Strongyloides ratti TaxID=34506 RepID=A0A090LTY0_STRRB|nr:Estradiol 17-beta-dehydrogenase 12 [Strongyloides ratti]CEF71672.1 Estradiol 17-beta-dehydrogenase 12 [Strongyloides ratti]
MSYSILDLLFSFLKWYLASYITIRIGKCLWILINSIKGHFFTKPYDLSSYINNWAVVTGATDGIGKAYINELAKSRGIKKFFLIGRSLKKLEDIKKYMEDTYKAQVEFYVFDFASDDLNKLDSIIEKLDVGILINCAGTGPSEVANFVELPKGQGSQILKVNLMSTVKMVELVLPKMVEKDHGIIVNFASATSWRPLPYMSTYPSSKAGISFFTSTLVDEFKNTNVKIQLLIPLLVATKIAFYEKEESNNIFVVDPEEYARQAVNTIGNFPLSTGCFQHDVQLALATLIGFNIFKLFFVPIVMLRVHKKRVAGYIERKGKRE